MKFIVLISVIFFTLICGFSLAQANDPLASVPVLQRQFKDFTPKGFKLGLYDVKPRFSTAIDYTSNVLKSSSNVQSERLLRNKGDLTISRNFNGATVTLHGGAEYIKYQKTDDFDQINFSGFAGLSYIFSPVLTGDFQGYTSRTHQTRYENGTLISAFDPIKVDEYGFISQFAYRPGRIGWDFNLGLRDISYQDTELVETGAPVIQSDRDRTDYSAGFDIRYEGLSRGNDSGFTPFMGFNVTRSDYDNRQYDTAAMTFTGTEQSNTTYDATIGSDIKTGSKLRGVARIGYGLYDPDSNNLDAQTTGIANIDLTYLYTPLTNLMFNVGRFFTNDSNAGSGIIQTQLDAQIVHELTRRWIINTGVGYMERSFSSDIEEQTWSGTVGFTHRIDENLSLDGDIKYISRESNQQNGDYDETRAMIRLNTKF
jgi:hypothetical protein